MKFANSLDKQYCRSFFSNTCLALALLYAPFVQAQQTSYPNKPVTLVVAYAPGGGTDIMARLFGEQLSRVIGQPVVIENKAGAGGVIGGRAVAQAAPDGYTLLFSAMAELTISDLSTGESPYKLDDFAPISRIAYTPFTLLVNKDVPVSNVEELLSYSKSAKSPLTMAAPASYSYLTGGLFKVETGMKFEIARYKGSGPAMQDLIGGHVQFGFDTIAASRPQIQAGTVRALSIAAEHRSDLLPDIPTMGEAGYPNILGGAWFGLIAPNGVPMPVIKILQSAITEVLASNSFLHNLERRGFSPYLRDTPEKFRGFLENDTAKWHRIAKEVGY